MALVAVRGRLRGFRRIYLEATSDNLQAASVVINTR